MDPFLDGTGKTGTGQVSFTRKNLSESFHFLSEPFHFLRRVNGPLMFLYNSFWTLFLAPLSANATIF